MKLHTVPNQIYTQRVPCADGRTVAVAVISRDRDILAMYPAFLNSRMPTIREVQADAHWQVKRI